MNDALIVILIFAAFTVFIIFVLHKRGKDKIRDAWKLGPESQAWMIMRKGTPIVGVNGRQVFYEEGLVHRAELLNAFDRGVLKADEKGRCAGYPVENNIFPTTAVILKSQLSPEARMPCFRVHIGATDPYYNSEFDMERGNPDNSAHYVLAAGQHIFSGAPSGFICILPYCESQYDEYFATAAEYEREHDVLFQFDGQRYEETKYHLSQGHPLIAECYFSAFVNPIAHSSVLKDGKAICTLLVK
jgi:hypothetical protein